jgi:hypothetical protein
MNAGARVYASFGGQLDGAFAGRHVNPYSQHFEDTGEASPLEDGPHPAGLLFLTEV